MDAAGGIRKAFKENCMTKYQIVAKHIDGQETKIDGLFDFMSMALIAADNMRAVLASDKQDKNFVLVVVAVEAADEGRA